jgi:glycerol-3-phosphate acyltransferase PlsY
MDTAPWPLPAGPPDIGSAVALGLLAIGWLFGSFPSAVAVGRRVGVDPLREGEGNPGSANVWKLAGPRAGATVFALDVAKVVMPGILGYAVAGWWGAWSAAVGGVAGSMRPVPPGLRGGRGVNAGVGAFLVLHPPAAAAGLAVAGGAYAVTRSRVAAIGAGFVAYPVAVAALSVRSAETAWPLAGIGLLYLLLVGRFVATSSSTRPTT